MNAFISALWAEALKARRSIITPLTTAASLILPAACGIFMLILKNPEQARAMGLIGTKARIMAGVADWQSFLEMLSQGIAGLGAVLFALLTTWVFGREFSDHTAKELMALPAPRWIFVFAKFVLLALWALALTLLIFAAGIGVGTAVDIPGWSGELVWTSFRIALVTALLTFMLMPLVAFFAGLGRGYLLPLGWTFLALAFANIVGALGRGDWFPWSVPILISGMVKSHADQIGLHSYLVVTAAFIAGIIATFAWWRNADQAR